MAIQLLPIAFTRVQVTLGLGLWLSVLASAACVSTSPGPSSGSPGTSGGSDASRSGDGDSGSASASEASADAAGSVDAPPSDGALIASAPGSPSWNNVAIGGGGFVSGIVFSPVQSGLVYARTDVGGFYRWEDATSVWAPLTDGFPAALGNYLGGESIAPDPVNANIVYAAGGMYPTAGNGVILRSTDQGTTWAVNPIPVTMGGNSTGRGMGERLAVDPNNDAILFFGSRNDGLYTSVDSSATWTQVTTFPTIGDATYGLPVVVFNKASGTAAGSTNIFVAAASRGATNSNLYQTNDGGVTWALVSGGPTGLMVHHASLGSDGTLWLAYSSDYGPYNVTLGTLSGQVWKYATATGVWTNVTPSTNWGGMAGGISVDAENPMHVVVSTLDWYAPDRLLATTNGGTTWQVIAQPPLNVNSIDSTYDVNGAQYWLVRGAVGTGATNWVEAVAQDPFNSSRVMYGTGAGVWTSTNTQAATGANGQGVTWTFLDKGLEQTVPAALVPSVHGAFLGAIGDLGGMRNVNLDVYSTTGEYANPIDSVTRAIDFAEGNPNFVVRIGSSGVVASDVAYSSNNGQTWTPCATAAPGYTTANEMRSLAVAADGSGFIVSPAKGFGSPSLTTDNCATWTAVTGLPSGALLASDRVTPGTFYASSAGILYASTDSGSSFTAVNTFMGGGTLRAVFGEAGEVWVATTGGLYQFTSAGATQNIITTVTAATGVGFGMAAPGNTHPAVFIIGTVAGQYGFFRSDDGAGASWTRFNDDTHQYGSLQGNFIAGDEGVYGRAYLTTGGRGYVYYDMP